MGEVEGHILKASTTDPGYKRMREFVQEPWEELQKQLMEASSGGRMEED